jgi:broad specificity phosphatase PhoE
MEIVLMRHGRPAIDVAGRMTPLAFREFMAAYDRAPLDRTLQPSDEARSIASGCGRVVCSDLGRSIESAGILGHDVVHLRDEMFREILMPHAPLSYPRLSVGNWVGIFRTLQLFGYSLGAESVVAGNRRAARCAALLVELTHGQPRVLFVGHAVMNYLIARRLRRLGWLGAGARLQRYWGFMRFTHPGSQPVSLSRAEITRDAGEDEAERAPRVVESPAA